MKKILSFFIVLLAILVPKDSSASYSKQVSAFSIKQENKKNTYRQQENQTEIFSVIAEELIEDDTNHFERKFVGSYKSKISKFSFNTGKFPANSINGVPASAFLVFRYPAIHIFIGVFRL